MSRKLACGCAYNNVERVASCPEHANDPALPLLNELRLIERQLEASHEELCIRTMEVQRLERTNAETAIRAARINTERKELLDRLGTIREICEQWALDDGADFLRKVLTDIHRVSWQPESNVDSQETE